MEKATKQLKYFMYCRKSSEDNKERQMQSIESQEKELLALAKDLNLEIIKTFREEKSAHKRGRPIFGEMMSKIEVGEANAILVWHGNRLSRNAFDGGWIITAIDEGVIKEVKTVAKTYYNESDDKFFLQLEFGIAKKDSDDKSRVVKRGLVMKCEKGWMPGVAPMGYLNTPELAGGSRYIKKDDERFEMLKKVWHMFASGQYRITQIQDMLNKEWGFKTRQFKRQGGNQMHSSKLYKMFNDPFYYGWFEYPRGSGILHKGAHEPMISKDIFDRVQILLGNKVKAQPKKYMFAYTGMAICGDCGCQITASEKWKRQKNGNVHHYIYYHCTRRKREAQCRQPGIRVEQLEKQVSKILEDIAIPTDFHQWAMKWLSRVNENETRDQNTIWDKQQREYTKCRNALSELIGMRAAKEIDTDEFIHQKEVLTERKVGLEKAMGQTGKRSDDWLKKAEDVLVFAEMAQAKFTTGTLETKRMILGALGRNLVLRERKLTLSLDDILFPVQTMATELNKQPERLEPPKNGVNKRKTDDFSSAFPTLLRGRDSNPELRVMSPARCRFSTPRYH